MRCATPDNAKYLHVRNDRYHLLLILIHKMEAPKNHVDIFAEVLLDFPEHRDNSGMRTSGNNHQTFLCINYKGFFRDFKLKLA